MKLNTSTNYLTPQPPVTNDALYLAKIVAIEQNDHAVTIYYEFAAGPNAGWAAQVYIRTGSWPFRQRIDRKYGSAALRAFLESIGRSDLSSVSHIDLNHGLWNCVDVQWTEYNGHVFPQVKRVYSSQTYPFTADDFRISADKWAKGSPDVNHAVALAHNAPYPVLLADTQERHSPMIDYCAENRICIIPVSGMPGDYMIPNGSIVVDRKANLSELYHNFSHGQSWLSYAIAAELAAAQHKMLVFVTAVEPADHVQKLCDLEHWNGVLPGGTPLQGKTMLQQIRRCLFLFPHVKFHFVLRDNLCEQIWKIVRMCPANRR